MVPKSFVQKSWLSSGVLIPKPITKVQQILERDRGTVEPARTPQYSHASSIEKACVRQRAEKSSMEGADWLETPEAPEEESNGDEEMNTELLGFNIATDDIRELNERGIIEYFTED